MSHQNIVREIVGGMTVDGRLNLDAYANEEIEHRVKPLSDYANTLWDHMQVPASSRGATMPWKNTHAKWQFRPGEISIWTGKRGEGKSLVTGMVALGLVQQGERCLIASLEMAVLETLERMARQATGVETPTVEYLKEFFAFGDKRLWFYDHIGTAPERSVIGLCKYAVSELGVTHIFLDSLMMIGFDVTSQWQKLEKQAAFVRTLVAIARDWNVHIHLVAHMRKASDQHRQGSDDVKGGGDIVDLAGACYLIRADQKKKEETAKLVPDAEVMQQPDYFLSCEKNRQGPVGDSVPLWLHEQSLQLVMTSNVKRLSFLSSSSGSACQTMTNNS